MEDGEGDGVHAGWAGRRLAGTSRFAGAGLWRVRRGLRQAPATLAGGWHDIPPVIARIGRPLRDRAARGWARCRTARRRRFSG